MQKTTILIICKKSTLSLETIENNRKCPPLHGFWFIGSKSGGGSGGGLKSSLGLWFLLAIKVIHLVLLAPPPKVQLAPVWHRHLWDCRARRLCADHQGEDSRTPRVIQVATIQRRLSRSQKPAFSRRFRSDLARSLHYLHNRLRPTYNVLRTDFRATHLISHQCWDYSR